MATSKGKLRSSSRVFDLDQEDAPRLNNNNAPSVIEYETLSWSKIILGWVKSIFVFLLLGILLIAGVYAGLAGTILYGIVNVDNKTVTVVARGTYVGGVVPEGETIYISTTHTIEGTFISNLVEGFTGVPGGATVEVLAGPIQEIKINAQKKTIDLISNGKTVETIKGTIADVDTTKKVLQNEYIVRCVGGACEAGELFIIQDGQISGEIISQQKVGGN